MLFLWILLLMLFILWVIPLVQHLWSLTKSRPSIYIILNIIIVCILISSSSILHFKSLFLKLQKKADAHHNIARLISQTSQKLLFSFDDDTWWRRLVNNEETEHFTQLHEPHIQTHNEEETEWFEPRIIESSEKDENHDHVKRNVAEEVVEEENTLDETWKAIMEAKSKGSGPQLKKSETWSAGDPGGGGEAEKVRNNTKGRLARYRVELKKWRTFSRDVVQEKQDDESRGGRDTGWKRMEMALTYHDELKKRADAFIAQFTQDMRLQRLESDQRFLEMINR